jgi:PRTRC genetic system protein B
MSTETKSKEKLQLQKDDVIEVPFDGQTRRATVLSATKTIANVVFEDDGEKGAIVITDDVKLVESAQDSLSGPIGMVEGKPKTNIAGDATGFFKDLVEEQAKTQTPASPIVLMLDPMAVRSSPWQPRTLLPANLLLATVDCLMWHLPSQRRRIYVQTADKTFNADINGREVLHPALLFMAKESSMGRDLYIWALDTNERPTEQTKLFRAPYFNIYDNAHLCEGNYKLPSNCDPAHIAKWEESFFSTSFTHSNTDQRQLTAHPHGHNALWREMAKTRRKLFVNEYLKPANDAAGKQLTIGKVIL